VSEFGPSGYWDPSLNRTSRGLVAEENENEKADWYREQWKDYVKAYQGYNLGGIAYCWHDRMEGSNTWFGLSDYRGRLKPSYYALQEMWTGTKQQVLPAFRISLPDGIKAGEKYVFKAIPSEATDKELKYEWTMNKNNYLEEVDVLSYDKNDPEVEVEIPKERSEYRLYLYVSDESGNVSTASLALKVY
jgi:hypothetical protein